MPNNSTRHNLIRSGIAATAGVGGARSSGQSTAQDDVCSNGPDIAASISASGGCSAPGLGSPAGGARNGDMNRDARHRRDGCAAPRFEGVPSGTTYERAYGDDMCGLGLRCAWYGDQAKSAQHTSVCHSTLGARSGAGPGLGLGSARQTWTTLVWGVLAGELVVGQRVVLCCRTKPRHPAWGKMVSVRVWAQGRVLSQTPLPAAGGG